MGNVVFHQELCCWAKKKKKKKKKNKVIQLCELLSAKAYVTLDHKTSLKSLEYICSNSQTYILWVKIIDFSFMPKINRILSTDRVPWRYFVTPVTGFVVQGHI